MTTMLHRRRDDGAALVVVTLAIVLLLACAALAIDISYHVNERQALSDTLDTAAQAGAFELPDDPDAAEAAAREYAAANDPDLGPLTVDFWCVVGSVGSGGVFVVDVTHIPVTCNPGPAPYNIGRYAGMECSAAHCAIPCDPDQGDTCNTMRVADSKVVPYRFGPVVGIDQGNTGTLVSAACKGDCGTLSTSPLDIMLVVDRTGSMGNEIEDLEDAVFAVRDTLSTPEHRLGIALLGESWTDDALDANGGVFGDWRDILVQIYGDRYDELFGARFGYRPRDCLGTPADSSARSSDKTWLPAPLADDFQVDGSRVDQVADCIGEENSASGTNFGGPLSAARQELIDNGRPDARKAIVFMTDGEANEPYRSTSANCDYGADQATAAKAADILVVTIAYRLERTNCGGVTASSLLASMASEESAGVPSRDDGGDGAGGHAGRCLTNASAASENADDDYFFCTPRADDLESVFQAAVSSIGLEGIKFILPPGTA